MFICSFCEKVIPAKDYFNGDFLQLVIPGNGSGNEITHNFCDYGCLAFYVLNKKDQDDRIHKGESS